MSALRSTFNCHDSRAARGRSALVRAVWRPSLAVANARRAAWALACVASLALTGCNAILWGNIGVLAVAVGIFLGTVFLSRSSAASRSASRSLSPTSSGAGSNSADNGRS